MATVDKKRPSRAKPNARPAHLRGQGRKKGVPVPLRERVHRLALIRKRKENEDPVDYMLRVMRDPRTSVRRKDEMAKASAGFVRPRLTTQKVIGGDPSKGERPLQHKFEIELVDPSKKKDDDE